MYGHVLRNSGLIVVRLSQSEIRAGRAGLLAMGLGQLRTIVDYQGQTGLRGGGSGVIH